jgi:hypothetical protein
MKSLVWVVWFGVALPVHGETGARALRAMFGPPVKKTEAPPGETFVVRPGVEMTVTYATADGRVCKLEIPSGVAGKREVDGILEQVVPLSTRGGVWNRMQEWTGIAGVASTYYERVIVSEDVFTPKAIDKRPGATVLFKDRRCGWKPGDPFDKPPGR